MITIFLYRPRPRASFFDVTRETLSEWARKGAPKVGRGKWNLKELVAWRLGGGKYESPESRKLKAEADLKEAKAAQEKIKLGVTREKFVPAYEVRSEMMRLMANLKKSLLAIGHNVAADLASLDMNAAEIARNEVDKRIKEALLELSKGGVYHERRAKKRKV